MKWFRSRRDTLNWGVLGCGRFAMSRTIPALLRSPSSRLLGVASRDTNRAREAQEKFDLPRWYGSYEALLDDPSIAAVYIATSNASHATLAIQAAQRGKHILCEKPITVTHDQALNVASAVASHRVQAMEAMMWRFHRQHEIAHEIVISGTIGAVRLVRGAFSFLLQDRSDSRWDAMAGGSLLDLGCYPVSASRFYFGAEPTHVFAWADLAEGGADRRVAGALRFEQGHAAFDCGFDLPLRSDMEVVGDTGIIHIPAPWVPERRARIDLNGRTIRLPAFDHYVTQFEHFASAILTGSPLRYGLADAVAQMACLGAIKRSLGTHAVEAPNG
jgi:D-xylose 1-dehydrogenase (NADP+, D-xylono-1,5-lactone-forming)